MNGTYLRPAVNYPGLPDSWGKFGKSEFAPASGSYQQVGRKLVAS